ncbi:MAG TPA: hypothetical protein VHO67_13510 [Polyangia bacterium]|nr:hypothetical protein [Polyangia bacterium]
MTKLVIGLVGALVVVGGCGGSSPSDRNGTGGHAGAGATTGGAGGHAGGGGAHPMGGQGGPGGGQGQTGGQGGTGAQGQTGGTAGSTTGAGNADGGLAGSGGAPAFSVSGTVTGLTGSGLVLQDGAGNQLSVDASGAFTFGTKLAAGTGVAVAVAHQPTSPTQTCVVTGGTSAGLAADLTTVSVTCTTNSYKLGGTVTGLSGSGLVLQDNHGDDLAVTASGAFTFATAVPSGTTYTVSVKTQPSGPAQTCQVSGGTGTIGAADVTSVSVNCAISTYTVGGTVTGLAGTGLVLQNGGADDLSVTGNGSFAFATPVASGHAFAVTVKTQPGAPAQVCSVTQGTGTVASANITSVAVVCATKSYTVAGTVTGLAGAGLMLQDNLGDNLSVTADGSFAFTTKVADGAMYSVTVLTQPSSPSQTCTVAHGSGTIAGAGVSNVAITCMTNAFAVGGSVVGLVGSGLTLHNGSQDLVITQNGGFAFPGLVASGSPFAVTVSAQPVTPAQSCVVSGGSGTVGGSAVTSVTVNCATDQFTIGGTISGLAGAGLTLSLNNGASTLSATGNGTFSFPSTLADGSAYAVTVASQPAGPAQTCTVSQGTGNIASANIATVTVNCATNSYAIGGTVSGLAGMGLTLRNEGGDDLTVMADGSFVFPTNVLSGQAYDVTIAAQPVDPWQTCTVSAGSGGVTGADITNVAITCTTNAYPIGGTVSGLASAVTVTNGPDTVVVTSNGAFVFPTAVESNGTYAVSVTAQPNNPSQTCTVGAGAGTVAGAAVTNVAVTCVTNTYAVGGLASGVLGTGLTLQDNGGDDLVVNGDGTFTFPTAVPSGGTYAVTIKTQPSGPTQTCTLAGASGSIGASAVTSVSVNCSTNAYSISGTVTGLTGSGLVVQNNGGGDVALSGSGTFAFAAPLLSGAAYNVTVKTQPTSPWQTCTVAGGSGTVTNSNVTVQITCAPNPYSVSVNVMNLAGSGLVLQDNAGDDLAITANGVSTFATPVASGLTYAVTVLSQPTNPWQTCTVTGPSGTIGGSGVTLAVNCVNNKYAVGGTVSGLSGSGLVLQDNAGDNLSVSGNGTFTFGTKVASGSPYAVTVLTPPSSPNQNCAVSNGTGTIGGSAVSNVTVTCTNVVVCASGDENTTVSLACPAGQKISAIDFASYGTPNGACGNFTVSSCNATVSTMDVSTACLGFNACSVPATNGTFGDPCVGTFKRLYIQARCQ